MPVRLSSLLSTVPMPMAMISWKLAAEMAFALTGNMNLATNAIQAYNAYFTEAAGEDAGEENQEEAVQDRLMNARWEGI